MSINKKHVKTFWNRRFLLYELVKKGIKLKYRRSYLGILWSMLEPILTTIVLTIVFGTLFGNNDKEFPLYILCGRLVYSFFATGTKTASKSIRLNAAMIKKVYIPKYLYPLSCVLYNYVIFAISLIVMVPLAVYCNVTVTWHIIEAIIPLLLLFILTFGVGMICILSGYGIYMGSAFNAYYVFKCNFLLSGTFNEQRVCVDFKMESVVLYDPEFS